MQKQPIAEPQQKEIYEDIVGDDNIAHAVAEAYPEAPAEEEAAPVINEAPEDNQNEVVPPQEDAAKPIEPESPAEKRVVQSPAPEPAAPTEQAILAKTTAAPARKKKVRVELDDEDDDDEEEFVPIRPQRPRKGSNGSYPPYSFFPLTFGSTSGGAIAVANSFSTGKGGSATSHATAYGSPSAKQKASKNVIEE